MKKIVFGAQNLQEVVASSLKTHFLVVSKCA